MDTAWQGNCEEDVMIEIKMIDHAHKGDINIKNEPFALFGRMIPSYTDEKWEHTIHLLEKSNVTTMCFPDENYDYDAMAEQSVFIGAYDGEACIGLAILQHSLFRYMYLYDLKVACAYRKQGVAFSLIEKAKELCKEHHYNGIYTQGQDNNLAACQFYLKSGFQLGGLNTNVYKWTSQEGKSDILFYLDC